MMNAKEAKEELDRYMSGEEIHYYESEFFEKTRRRSKEGDVFVIKLKECGLYFYGKVIKKKVEHHNGFFGNHTDLMFLYKTPTKEIVIPEKMDSNDVFKAILMLRHSGWGLGLFKTICNLPVTEEDLSVDYGFENILSGKEISADEIEEHEKNGLVFEYTNDDGKHKIWAYNFVDEYGEVINHIPDIVIQNRIYPETARRLRPL